MPLPVSDAESDEGEEAQSVLEGSMGAANVDFPDESTSGGSGKDEAPEIDCF